MAVKAVLASRTTNHQSERKNMKATVLYGPRDVRFEAREMPKIEKPTDAILRIAAACSRGAATPMAPFCGPVLLMN
jgi:hypothetical protein